MRLGVVRSLVPLLVCACLTILPKSRIEPQERAAVELGGDTEFDVELPGSALDTDELVPLFTANLTRELARRRSVAANRNRSDAILAVKLVSVALVPQSGDLLVLHITSAARVESGGENPGKPRSPWHACEYESPARPRSEWTAEHGKMLDDEIAAGFAQVARDLVASAIRSQREPK